MKTTERITWKQIKPGMRVILHDGLESIEATVTSRTTSRDGLTDIEKRDLDGRGNVGYVLKTNRGTWILDKTAMITRVHGR